MPNLNDFLASGGKGMQWAEEHRRAVGITFMADYREGITLTLTRGGSTLAPQTVVLAPIDTTDPSAFAGAAASTGSLDLLVIGPRNHPTLPNFDVSRGDRFSIGAARYQVMFVDTSMDGKTEAHCASIQ
jgi:hypothetical protein